VVTKIDPSGNHAKHTAFFMRLANGTREFADEEQVQRYIAQRWGAGA